VNSGALRTDSQPGLQSCCLETQSARLGFLSGILHTSVPVGSRKSSEDRHHSIAYRLAPRASRNNRSPRVLSAGMKDQRLECPGLCRGTTDNDPSFGVLRLLFRILFGLATYCEASTRCYEQLAQSPGRVDVDGQPVCCVELPMMVCQIQYRGHLFYRTIELGCRPVVLMSPKEHGVSRLRLFEKG
jgi:hypothetical protein